MYTVYLLKYTVISVSVGTLHWLECYTASTGSSRAQEI